MKIDRSDCFLLLKRAHSLFVLAVVSLFWLVHPCLALSPEEIVLVANKKVRSSVGLAQYYMKKRGVPEGNLLKLKATNKETCSREDYEREVVPRVRKFLKEKNPGRRIRCLLIMHGMPLRVAPPEMSAQDREELKRLRKKEVELRLNEKGLKREDGEGKKEEVGQRLKEVEKEIGRLRKSDQGASFDSEIALVLAEDYPLSHWVPNPYFIGFRGKKLSVGREEALMVSRLDGPDEKTVKRIIDDSLEAEKEGLNGVSYFDARWPEPGEEKKKEVSGYAAYDLSIHRAAERVKKSGRTPVVLNEMEALFQPGECPRAALYCGWYSLAKYVDAFKWQKGAVGYHIASAECATLKKPNSQVWCKRMLEEGVAATLGPVDEPYVQAFAVPEVFFGLLVDGRFTLAECYALSNPFWSWQMVLIGDPLYRPFGRKE